MLIQVQPPQSGSARYAVAVIALAALLGLSPPAGAEMQIGVYGGLNENFSSRVKVDKAPVSEDRTIDWDGKSFEMPPYWGVRGTYWLSAGPSWGFGLDFAHAKASADLNFATDPTYSRLEFTDGLNVLTFNVFYRFAPVLSEALVPYVGLGAGVAIPHVEVSLKAFPGQPTFEYQLAGPAAQVLAGVEYRLGGAWSLFAETKLGYSRVDADLAGGGRLRTDIWSPHVAVGVTYRFGADIAGPGAASRR